MDKVSVKVTVFFDEPFWAGVFERIDGEKLTACKVVFGAEPGDDKVQEYRYELKQKKRKQKHRGR